MQRHVAYGTAYGWSSFPIRASRPCASGGRLASCQIDEAPERTVAALAVADRTLARLADASERTKKVERRASPVRADRAEAAISGERKRADQAEDRADGLCRRVTIWRLSGRPVLKPARRHRPRQG